MLQTAAYYLSFIVIGMTTASFGPSLPGFAANTGSTLAGVGALFVFHRIGYITGSLGGGRIMDRLRGKLIGTVISVFLRFLITPLPYQASSNAQQTFLYCAFSHTHLM